LAGTKDEYRKEIAEIVRSTIFPCTQFFLHDEDIGYGSKMQEFVEKTININLCDTKKKQWWMEQRGGQEVMRDAIRKRRQSTANGMKGGFRGKH
jgi:hypothetical protein